MGKILKLSLVILGVIGISAMTYATNPDSFLITCTPVITYSVTISTPAEGLRFSQVDMNKTYVHTSTATIRNSGNVSADWKIKGNKLDTWMLGAEPALDTVRLLAVLKSSLATEGEFDTTLDLIQENVERNMNSGANAQHSVDQTGDNVLAGQTRLLSIRLDSPTDSTVSGDQRFRIEIRAYHRNTF